MKLSKLNSKANSPDNSRSYTTKFIRKEKNLRHNIHVYNQGMIPKI